MTAFNLWDLALTTVKFTSSSEMKDLKPPFRLLVLFLHVNLTKGWNSYVLTQLPFTLVITYKIYTYFHKNMSLFFMMQAHNQTKVRTTKNLNSAILQWCRRILSQLFLIQWVMQTTSSFLFINTATLRIFLKICQKIQMTRRHQTGKLCLGGHPLNKIRKNMKKKIFTFISWREEGRARWTTAVFYIVKIFNL